MNAILFVVGIANLLIMVAASDGAESDKKEAPLAPSTMWNGTREAVSQAALAAKRLQPLSWTELAAKLNCSPTWLASVVMGQSSADETRALQLEQLLHLPSGSGVALTWPPLKAQYDSRTEFQDPLIYRLHEVALVYGTSIKAMIHELFGDGIMSAIDFRVDVTRAGDRVHILLDGKFLAYRRW